MAEKFAGDKKTGNVSFFYKLELKMSEKLTPKIPLWLETYHLTLLTIPWSLLVIYFSFKAQNNINWLWLASLIIVFQYITDVFDGKVGKLRKTGLIKWGYYMDHFLDFIFACSVVLGYYFIFPASSFYLALILIVAGGFMVNSFLYFSVTNKFKLDCGGLGATEARIFLLLLIQ